MDYKLAFTYIFSDPDWIKKIALGAVMALFGFLIIPAIFALGYYMKAIRNVAEGADPVLPEWDDWGDLFVSGLKLIVVYIVFGIAAAIIIGIFHRILGWAITSLVQLALYAVIPAITMQYARREEIGDIFKFDAIVELVKANPSEYIIVAILALIASWIGALGVILLIIGVFFTVVYSLLVTASLYGQYLREYGQQAAIRT